jgi:hypothetical protein
MVEQANGTGLEQVEAELPGVVSAARSRALCFYTDRCPTHCVQTHQSWTCKRHLLWLLCF